MSTKIIEEKTSGAGVFKVTIYNSRASSVDISIGARATSISGGPISTQIDNKVQIPPQEEVEIAIPKPFFGDDYEHFTGIGPLLGTESVKVWITGIGHRKGFGYKPVEFKFVPRYYKNTLFVDIPDFTYTIE